ncbi:MAG TPA: electron transfer flavoprotein subunit alpha/FixB family protein [Dehalococcoidales bacterium]|nr:electron transfer flavoprotein subunit alpha/FixB family protein [Dehalococcoidales bacterium]
MSEHRGVLVFCEIKGDKLLPISTEGLGAGRKLADALGQDLSAVILGSSIAGIAPQAIMYGASKVYAVDDPLLKEYQSDAFANVVDKIVEQVMPSIVIMGQTDIGRDLAPRLAFRLGTAAVMDCVDLAIDPDSKRLLQTKPVYGGNAQAVYVTDTDPQIVTIRTKAMAAPAPDMLKKGEVVNVPAGIQESDIKAKVVNRAIAEVSGIKLEDAQIVVSGGRGIGGPDGFKQLEELAKVLKGAVGASRPPCDNGWIPDTAQVGLTGKIIAPEVYIAVAISGSSQHMSGCSGAKNIIAINKDKEANIFRYARYGAVGDWKKVLPAFIAKVKELVAA